MNLLRSVIRLPSGVGAQGSGVHLWAGVGPQISRLFFWNFPAFVLAFFQCDIAFVEQRPAPTVIVQFIDGAATLRAVLRGFIKKDVSEFQTSVRMYVWAILVGASVHPPERP